MTSDAAQPLPSAMDAEKGLLGCMLLDPGTVIGQVRGRIGPEAFHLPAHRLIYELILEKVDAREPVEVLSLQQTLLDRGKIAEVGGPAVLVELNAFVVDGAAWSYYADVIADKAARRRGMELMSGMWAAFLDSSKDWRESALKAQQALSGMLATRQKNAALTMAEVMTRTMEVLEERVENQGKITGGLLTGFTDLDRMFLGLTSPHIVTIAGRPSMGKSVLLADIALHIAAGEGDYDEFDQPPKRVLLISTEMSYDELGQRFTAARSGVCIRRLGDGWVRADAFACVTHAMAELGQVALHVAYLPGTSAEEIASFIHGFDAQFPDTAAYVIDHMTDVGCDGVKDKGNQTALTTMAWTIVTDAIKRCEKIGFLGCQLNREGHGNMPKLTDLKQSGKIEEVSNAVVMIHRQHYYELLKDSPDPDVDPAGAVFLVAKNRNGRRGPVPAFFDADVTRFRSSTRKLYSLNDDERQVKSSFFNKQ